MMATSLIICVNIEVSWDTSSFRFLRCAIYLFPSKNESESGDCHEVHRHVRPFVGVLEHFHYTRIALHHETSLHTQIKPTSQHGTIMSSSSAYKWT